MERKCIYWLVCLFWIFSVTRKPFDQIGASKIQSVQGIQKTCWSFFFEVNKISLKEESRRRNVTDDLINSLAFLIRQDEQDAITATTRDCYSFPFYSPVSLTCLLRSFGKDVRKLLTALFKFVKNQIPNVAVDCHLYIPFSPRKLFFAKFASCCS